MLYSSHVMVPKDKGITGRLYRDMVLRRINYYQKRHLVTEVQYVCLLHDNAPAQTSKIIKQLLKSKKVFVWPHP